MCSEVVVLNVIQLLNPLCVKLENIGLWRPLVVTAKKDFKATPLSSKQEWMQHILYIRLHHFSLGLSHLSIRIIFIGYFYLCFLSSAHCNIRKCIQIDKTHAN